MDDEAFWHLLKKVTDEIRAESKAPDKWISGDEAMAMLRITSRTTLQKLRDEGHIRFSQPMTKVILYDSESILEYIEKHAKNTF